MTSITTLPCDNFDAASIASYNLLLISSLIINLSTITSILCFLFFSSSLASLVSNSSPSTRSLIYPSIDKLLNQVGSKYLLVNIVSKRVREMKATGHYQMAPKDYVSKKDIGKALEEISKDMIHLKDN